MNAILMLAVLTTGQFPWPEDNHPLTEDYRRFVTKANDVAFTCAVEQSIAREPGTTIPEPCRSLIEDLGSVCYDEREAAYDGLLKASEKNPRVFWGLRHPDISVRLYCNKVLWRMSTCKACLGIGTCTYDAKQPKNDDEREHPG